MDNLKILKTYFLFILKGDILCLRCADKLLGCQCPKIGSPFISSLRRREEGLCKGEHLPSNCNKRKKYGFSVDSQRIKVSKQVQKTSVS